VDAVCRDRIGSEGFGASVELNVSFPSVDWAFQQSVYGWAALQYQAMAIGSITLHEDIYARVSLFTEGILEMAVNDESTFGGDFYGFGRVPAQLNLFLGENKIVLRLIRDVRAMGGVGSPLISVRLKAQRSGPSNLQVVEDSVILPDVVNGKLASSYGSVIVRNEMINSWVYVTGLESKSVSIRAGRRVTGVA
jgi:hypothetical protein